VEKTESYVISSAEVKWCRIPWEDDHEGLVKRI